MEWRNGRPLGGHFSFGGRQYGASLISLQDEVLLEGSLRRQALNVLA